MQYLSPPDSPTSELEVEEAGIPASQGGASARGRQLTEAQEHYSKQHADWLPQPLKGDLSIAVSSPASGVAAAPTTASARKSRFGLLVPASPAFVAGGSLHSTSTQNKAVLLPPTLSASPLPAPSSSGASSAASGSSSLSSPAAASGRSSGTSALGGATAASAGPPPGAGSPFGAGQAPSASAATHSPLNIDSRTVLNAAAKTRVLSAAGGLSGSGTVKTLENSATSAAAGALVAAAFGRGAAVTGSTPQSAKFAAAAAAAEAAARAVAAGRTEKGLPPDALVDGLPVQSFSHLRVMKEGTCVEVFCLPLLFQQARSTGRLILGRAEAADIPTEHPSCSRLHCELRRMPVGASDSGDGSSGSSGAASSSSSSSRRFTYTLKDLGSGHGTLINGGRVAAGKDTVLEDEDEIQLGFSQRLYLFFTGKDTLGPDPPSPPKEPQPKKPSPSGSQAHHSAHPSPRARSAAVNAESCPPPPAAPIPAPPSTPPPPPAPPMWPAGDEGPGGMPQRQQQGAGGGGAAGAAADAALWRTSSEIEQSSEARWRVYQQHMEQLHQQRLASVGGSPLSYCIPGAATDTEQAMLLQQQQHAIYSQQQQQETYAEDAGTSGCGGMGAVVAAGGGGAGTGGWGWETAAQQQQLLYWQQQQQQGVASETAVGWEAEGQQEQMWNAPSFQEHAMQQYMAEQYVHEQQCWDAAQGQQHPCAAAWSSPQLQQQQASEESCSFQQQQQRRSGWSPLSSCADGEQQEELPQGGKARWHPNFAGEGGRGSSTRGRGGGGAAATAGAAAGGSGGGPFNKRRTLNAAARKLLWQHAGKKQQGGEKGAAAADDAAAAEGTGGNKRLRLDGAKVALWGRGLEGAAAAAAGGAQGTAASAGELEGGSGGAAAGLMSGSVGSSSSGTSVLQASNAGGLPQVTSAAGVAGSPKCGSSSSSGPASTPSIEQSSNARGEEGTTPRVFCAHILLSFVRRVDVEPWQGSPSFSNRSSTGALLGRGGRVVTRSRSDALSSLKSVKDITAEDPTQFGEFAAELSDCPSSKKRGVLGWVHAGLPGGRPPTPQQQQTLGSSSKGREQQPPPQRRTATEVAAQQSVDAAAENSSSKGSEEKHEEWWLPHEAVEAAMQLQVGELSGVIESEHGAHLLLRLK